MQEETAPVFNYLFKVLAPVIYIILLYALFQLIGLDFINYHIYWIVIDYWIIRFILTIVKGRLGLVNWIVQIVYWISSIGLAFWVCSLFKKVPILPSPTALIEQLWLIIILFLYSVLNKIEPSRIKTKKRIDHYIQKHYLHYRIEFDHLLENENAFQKALLYSIMIYEDFNRPKVARFLEKVFFFRSTAKHTYGIMQVSSNHYLSDEESIIVAKKRIEDDLRSVLAEFKIKNIPKDEYKRYFLARRVAQKYNPGDSDYGYHVGDIFEILYNAFYSSNKTRTKVSSPIPPERLVIDQRKQDHTKARRVL